MNLLKSAVLGVAASALLSSAAMAADAMTAPVFVEEPAAVVIDNFFEGPYVGIYGGARFKGHHHGSTTASNHSGAVIGGVAGFNFAAADFFLVGVEVQGGVAFLGNNGTHHNAAFEGFILGKAGVVATDNVLIYASGGFGVVGHNNGSNSSQGVLAIGGGVEFAATENVSFRLEGHYLHGLNNNNTNSFDGAGRVTAGVLFHF